jgi:SagB-type dehydrogenase family enzyme
VRTAVSLPDDHVRYRRSPFLLVRWEGERIVLTDVQHARDYGVGHSVLVLLGGLDRWRTIEELADAGINVSPASLDPMVTRKLIRQWDPRESEPVDDLRFWNLFDLAVQRRSHTGGYFPQRAAGRGPPPPAFGPPRDGARTSLPAAAALLGDLDALLSMRRSVTRYADRPLRLEEISDLLQHSARIVHTADAHELGTIAYRPFPAGGARAELEIYVVANAIDGLDPGAHHYDARQHELIQVARRDAHHHQLNLALATATGEPASAAAPAVLLLTSVFDRVMWKYDRLSLSVIYRNCGCFLQTAYLVATALGLAPCAVGAVPELPTARWLGLDPLDESVVGCLLLGPRA